MTTSDPRVIIVGDVHGCYQELVELLVKVDLSPRDRLIFAGDLIDRGPDPKACVELAMQHEAVLGNHEESHLRKRRRGTPLEKMSPDHARTQSLLHPEHFDYFASLPLYIDLPQHNAMVVHAAVIPDVPVSIQDPQFILHGQMIMPPDNRWGYFREKVDTWWPGKHPPESKFWTDFYKGPKRVVFGHTVLSAPLLLPYATGIDTGCVYGWSLTALLLPSWETVQVKAKRSYYEGRPLTFPIGNVMSFQAEARKPVSQ